MPPLFPAIAILTFAVWLATGLCRQRPPREKCFWAVGCGVALALWFVLWGLKYYAQLGAAVLACWLLAVGICALGWHLVGRSCRGWRLHCRRGIVGLVSLGPLAAVRYAEMYSLPRWLLQIKEVTPGEWRHYLVYGSPGFLLAFLVLALVSFLRGRKRVAGDGKQFLVPAAGILVLLPLLNWYAAGVVDVYDCAYFGRYRRLTYVLVSRPGTVSAGDVCGRNLMHQARSPGMVRFLHDRGVDPDWRVRRGWQTGRTPLHVAANAGRFDLVQELLACGADVDVPDHERWTPLHRAAHENRLTEMQALLRAGARVECTDRGGNTALHWAALQGHVDAVAMLLASGASGDVLNAKGFTPMDLTTERTPPAVRQLLMKSTAEAAKR